MADKPACALLHTGPGLANPHNARRASTPIVNVVGDHATWHLDADAPLTSDIESLARPMSRWVGRSTAPEALGLLAQGHGVEAARADTAEAFNDLVASALKRRGPFLIEAVI